MQIETLKFFYDVVNLHSFSEAAEVNAVTQSTISQAVQRLESHLQVKLIDRSVRPWRVTEEGKLCHERCRDLVEGFARLEEEMRHRHDSQFNEIRVATIYSVGFSYLGHFSREFGRQNTGQKLTIDYEHPDEIRRRVLGSESDIGIMSFPPSRRDLNIIPWLEEEMVVVCSPGHSLAVRSTLRVSQLSGATLVGFDADLPIGKRIAQFLRSHGVKFKIALRFDNIEGIKRAVESSNYLAIIPAVAVERELTSRTLVALPFSDDRLTRELGIIYRKGRELTPACERFVKLLTDGSRIWPEHVTAISRNA